MEDGLEVDFDFGGDVEGGLDDPTPYLRELDDYVRVILEAVRLYGKEVVMEWIVEGASP